MRFLIVLSLLVFPSLSWSQYYENTQGHYDLVGTPKSAFIVEKRTRRSMGKTVWMDTTEVTFNGNHQVDQLLKTGMNGKNQTFTYYDDGKVKEAISYNVDYKVRFADSIAYNSFGSIEAIYRRYDGGNYFPVKLYSYDDQNQPLTEKWLTSTDSVYRVRSYYRADSVIEITDDYDNLSSCSREFLNAQGKTIKAEHFRFEDGMYLTEFFEYDSTQRLISESFEDHWPPKGFEGTYVRSGAVGTSQTFIYDSLGRVIQRTESPNENWKTTYDFIYNDAGKLTQKKENSFSQDSDEPVYSSVTYYKYDLVGNMIKSRLKVAKGPNWTHRYWYDSNNNWIKYSLKGKVMWMHRRKTNIHRTIIYYN